MSTTRTPRPCKIRLHSSRVVWGSWTESKEKQTGFSLNRFPNHAGVSGEAGGRSAAAASLVLFLRLSTLECSTICTRLSVKTLRTGFLLLSGDLCSVPVCSFPAFSLSGWSCSGGGFLRVRRTVNGFVTVPFIVSVTPDLRIPSPSGFGG